MKIYVIDIETAPAFIICDSPNEHYIKYGTCFTIDEFSHLVNTGEMNLNEHFVRFIKTDDEYIVSSAIKVNGTFITGIQHKDCAKLLKDLNIDAKYGREHQGFITSKKRFVTRSEAFIIAKKQNQIIHNLFDGVNKGELNSEDIFYFSY
jgi:hypothetical protein